ncbi:MAG: PH domain-containing protein [Deltaproteobacteria bacterium]|nr:PH domain-containing protein [Deltaproteobacteria bacterium]
MDAVRAACVAHRARAGAAAAAALLPLPQHALPLRRRGRACAGASLFRREINLTYRRIQDIHLRSGLFQRWLGLADVLVQTASGSATAEMTIEGLLEYEAVRDFLYARMRGELDEPAAAPDAALTEALQTVTRELAGVRDALAALAPR